ncbi:MAG: hypothetical protein JXR70_01480 [Spirochaetales bacterium]|nr:hypothetical protein [Spirochaetales bacterium]
MHKSKYERQIYIFIMALLCLILLIQFLRYLHINLDDKFIIYKYAMNFSNGKGFSFTNDIAVEGFSSFFYVLLMSVVFKIFHITEPTLDAVTLMSQLGKIITFLFSTFTILYLGKLLKKIFRLSSLVIFISLFLLVIRTDFVYHSTSGLETGVFIFFMAAYFYHLFNLSLILHPDKKNNYILLVIFGWLVLLTRVDGFIFIILTNIIWLIVLSIKYKPGWKKISKYFFKLSIPFILCLLGYELFRILYFHDIFPNTYYVKVPGFYQYIYPYALWYPGHNLIQAWQRIPITAIHYILPSMGFLFVLSLLLVALLYFSKRLKNKHRVFYHYNRFFNSQIDHKMDNKGMLIVLTLLLPLFSFYVAYTGGDWMPGYRYIMHYYSLFHTVFLAVVIHFVLLFLKYDQKLFLSFVSGALILLTTLMTVLETNRIFHVKSKFFYEIGNNYEIPEGHSFYAFWGNKRISDYFTLYSDFALELKEKLNSDESVAIYEVGCIGLLLGESHKIIDIGGLNTPAMAKGVTDEGIHSMCVAYLYMNFGKVRGPKDKYLLSESPKYIIFDTFVFMDNRNIPEAILDGHFKYIDSFKENRYGFFSIFERSET